MKSDIKCTCGGWFDIRRIDGDTSLYCPRCFTTQLLWPPDDFEEPFDDKKKEIWF